MNRKSKLLIFVASILTVVSTSSHAAVYANSREAFSDTAFVPCANGGLGEDVDFSGTWYFLGTILRGDEGELRVHQTVNFINTVGVGRVTGDIYRAPGIQVFNTQIGAGSLPVVLNQIYNFALVGQGQAANFRLQAHVLLTVNANGDVTASIDKLTEVCG